MRTLANRTIPPLEQSAVDRYWKGAKDEEESEDDDDDDDSSTDDDQEETTEEDKKRPIGALLLPILPKAKSLTANESGGGDASRKKGVSIGKIKTVKRVLSKPRHNNNQP